MALISCMKIGLCLIMVAVILSVIKWLVITVYHLCSNCASMCCLLWMALLHLITQIRWLASAIKSWRHLVLPLSSIMGALVSSSLVVLPGGWMWPMPRIVPMVWLWSAW